jgi:branched-chain amino acid transport system permease protein
MRTRLRNLSMTLHYEDDLKLFKSRQSRLGIAVIVLVAILLPLSVKDDFWLSVLNYAGIAAVGAIGLNLLTGYTGQVSLGHAFFIGIGAYCAVFFGGHHGLPLPVWLLGAAVVGGLVGAVVGPFALRLRGNYLAVVSLGLVFLGLHVFRNWRSISGGPGGTSVVVPLKLGPIDFTKLSFGNYEYTRNQSFFFLVWFVVAVAALLAKNITRTRPGRAMQAVRDRDVAAEVIGVSLARYKVGAFVISSALAAVAGALFASYQQFVQPDSWDLFLSIQYIAIIIVGGVGTIFGSVLGAIFIGAVPQLVDKFSSHIPLVSKSAGGGGGFHLTVFQLNQMIFGALIVIFLVLEPRGLAAVWLRIKAYFKAWPFSY